MEIAVKNKKRPMCRLGRGYKLKQEETTSDQWIKTYASHSLFYIQITGL